LHYKNCIEISHCQGWHTHTVVCVYGKTSNSSFKLALESEIWVRILSIYKSKWRSLFRKRYPQNIDSGSYQQMSLPSLIIFKFYCVFIA